jgi:phosphatidylserine/phosphatidylglycerophosphate/cardiolipin synthase-like enzyme
LAPPPSPEGDPWPAAIKPDMSEVDVAVARTEPAWAGRPLVDEWRRLTLAAIAAARRTIYLENQYFTSPVIAEAVARRLAEPDGPEVVFISAERSPSWFDRLTMDRTRTLVLRRLSRADVFGRFRAYHADTSAGRPIIIHAKLAITDDTVARIGSGNLNNRSSELDTECELAIEASNAATSAAIARLRDRLVGHYLGRTAQDVATAIERHGGLIGAIEALNRHGRLKPITPLRMGAFTSLIAAYHLGDPIGVYDAWRPWRRKRILETEVQAIARGDAR